MRNFTNPSKEFLRKNKLTYRPYAGIEILNDFKIYGDQHHIKTYFLYPSFPQSIYNRKSKVVNAYADGFAAKLKMPILNSPENAVFADSLFYDTEYHLEPAGKAVRTGRIIPLLKRELKK